MKKQKPKDVDKSSKIQQFQEDKNKDEIKRLKREKQSKENTIKDLEQVCQNMENEVKNLRHINVGRKIEIQELQKVYDENRNDIKKLETERAEQAAEISELEEKARFRLTIEERTTKMLFNYKDMIGPGTYGPVYKGKYYGSKVAVEEISEATISEDNLKTFKREMYIASQCRHPNLLQFICASRDQNRLLIVTELMDMSLRTFLNNGGNMEYEDIRLISLHVACGLNYLHSKETEPLVHCNISSANVWLWVENGSPLRAKLSNDCSPNLLDICKSAGYLQEKARYAVSESGESKQKQFDAKSNVFSYGILMCETSTSEIPDCNYKKRRNQIEGIQNRKIKELVNSCTKRKSTARPTMSEIIKFWQENPSDNVSNYCYYR